MIIKKTRGNLVRKQFGMGFASRRGNELKLIISL
jgi:hypothetical protein